MPAVNLEVWLLLFIQIIFLVLGWSIKQNLTSIRDELRTAKAIGLKAREEAEDLRRHVEEENKEIREEQTEIRTNYLDRFEALRITLHSGLDSIRTEISAVRLTVASEFMKRQDCPLIHESKNKT